MFLILMTVYLPVMWLKIIYSSLNYLFLALFLVFFILMGILGSISLPSFRHAKQKRDSDWTAQYNVGGNKIKKTKSQFFFLVRHNFSISEGSSNIEYSESALTDNLLCKGLLKFTSTLTYFLYSYLRWIIRNLSQKHFC